MFMQVLELQFIFSSFFFPFLDNCEDRIGQIMINSFVRNAAMSKVIHQPYKLAFTS